MLRILASLVLAAVTLHQPVTLTAGTRIACALGTAIDSRHAQPGDTFRLHCGGNANDALNGATVTGHITNVVQPRGGRARIAFYLDSIAFSNGASVPLRAFVVSPDVVRRRAPNPAYVPPLTHPGPTPPSTMVWQTDLGPARRGGAASGGVAYGTRPGAPIVGRVGTPVTLELSAPLRVP